MTLGPAQRPVRVLVVDDHADVRFLVRVILEDAGPGVVFAGEAAGADEALARLDAAAPDAVVVDAHMPGADGVECARRLLARRPGLAIVLCSGAVDAALRRRAAAAGIRACVSKDDLADLPRVVRAVLADG